MKTFMSTSALYIRLFAILLFVLKTSNGMSQEQYTPDDRFRHMEISLLTCSPHDEIYSLYGHTALRCCDSITGEDFVVNYGVFSFDQPYFILRFVFGLTDYCMGVVTMKQFLDEYSYYGCSVTQQSINLTEAEKATIMKALAINAMPENSTYRYNFFHDNCTTRARDMITDHLNGTVQYHEAIDNDISFRDMVHGCITKHPWTRFGVDLLLGLNADTPTTRSQQQFLPAHLQQDFSTATIMHDGKTRPLVKQTSEVLTGKEQIEKAVFPITPQTCFLVILFITLLVIVMEQRTCQMIWCYDLFMMLVCGLAGVVLTLMVFSHHPTVSLNLQILILNPLLLLFCLPICRRSRKGLDHWWWKAWLILCLLFLMGRFFQHYAEGMMILALTLLLRIISHQILVWRKAKANIHTPVSTS